MTTVTATVATAAGRSAAAITTATTTITIATATTVTTVTSNGHLLTAHQGDADDREENRDAQNQRAIHPRNPPQTGTGT
jgi:hypothetical protein